MKFKYNIQKNQNFLKGCAPSYVEYFLLIFGLLGTALCLDLAKIFNIEFTYVCGILSTIALAQIIYVCVWSIHSIIHACIVHHRLKNTKLDKEVTNEDK